MKYFSNQALFSDHYLVDRMDAHLEWAEDIGDAFAQLHGLYQAKRDILDGLNEAMTEAEFIRPALGTLGFAYIPQTEFTQAGRQLRPDYALFTDEAAKTEAYRFLKDEGKFYPRALSICDAKYWGRPLDVKRKADPRDEFKNTNPSFQIVNYLVGTDVDWGILTNGRLWRLYYQKARSRASTYYEVDLGLILEREDREAFRYFYHFFRQDALVKDPATDRNFLERVYEGSATYALQVQQELKGLIFEKIVPILAEGFVAWRRAELAIAEQNEASLRQVFTATLTLLYRLLFLLYAESRELLPVSDRLGYYRYSLTRLKREAMARLRREEVFSTVSDDLWNDLAALFRIIDRGDPALNVPTYNGGLFDRRSPKNAFLEEHRIADAYLVQALDLLTRRDDPDTGERRFIDYKDLDVRHLGSIYEGLLEFYLRIAQEDLAAVKERGVEVYKPLSEVKESRRLGVVRKGELYLKNDKGQRKATGSYYTPDYIVKYIVANTLGPIMDEREAAFAEAVSECEACRKKFKRARSSGTIKLVRDELATLEQRAVNCLLDIKVCDPAMGSGHFLVEAVAYLTDRIIDILNQYPENPVLARLAAIREQILANLEEQGIRIDRELLTDTNLLKRMVMKRCIYGVDLNPMAVELAKLSLWLDSFTVGAPLSFLDHHLKVGNSLIGIRDMMQYIAPASQREQELRRAIANTIYISSLTDSTFNEVRTSQTLFEECRKLLKPTKERLNVELATNFVDLGKITRAAQVAYSDIDSRSAADPESLRKFTLAQQVAEDKQFFHWELEFPEVFYTVKGHRQNPGFDVVVGNPPWIAVDNLTDEDKTFYRAMFAVAQKFDVAHAFVQQATALSRERGLVSMVIPEHSWIGEFHTTFRRNLLDSARLLWVASMKEGDFSGVANPASIFGSQITTSDIGEYEFAILRIRSPQDLERERGYRTSVRSLDEDIVLNTQNEPVRLFRIFFDPRLVTMRALFHRTPWEYLDRFVVVSDGIKTADALHEIMIQGDPQPEQRSKYTKALRSGVKIPDRYGVPHWDHWWVLREEYAEEYKSRSAFSYDTPRRMYCFSAPRRLIMRQTEPTIIATLDDVGYRFPNSIFTMALKPDVEIDLLYLLAVLNSALIREYYLLSSQVGGTTKPQLYINQLKSLPIRRIEFTTPEEERRELVGAGQALYGEYLDTNDWEHLLEFVDSRLQVITDQDGNVLEPEQADVVPDLLAYLAEQMIEMHKEKQAEAKGFLDWLADYTDLPLDDWKLKSYVRAYWKHPWSELQRALHQNRKRMKRDVEGREAREKIKREFEDSMAKLKPLLARIEATDRLIDQIVYRLYGLTEEGIAIVERPG